MSKTILLPKDNEFLRKIVNEYRKKKSNMNQFTKIFDSIFEKGEEYLFFSPQMVIGGLAVKLLNKKIQKYYQKIGELFEYLTTADVKKEYDKAIYLCDEIININKELFGPIRLGGINFLEVKMHHLKALYLIGKNDNHAALFAVKESNKFFNEKKLKKYIIMIN